MTCPRCQHENPADAAFCQGCGARLETACPRCATPNQLGAKFCKKCGQRLSGPQAEHAMPGPRFGPPESYTPKHLAEKILTSEREPSRCEGEHADHWPQPIGGGTVIAPQHHAYRQEVAAVQAVPTQRGPRRLCESCRTLRHMTEGSP